MKQKLLFTAGLIFGLSFAHAQYFDASGTGAVDWTMTDYTGNTTLTLSTMQAENKIVLYDYFFTTCFYCTVSAPELEDIYVEHGPTGTNTLEIVSLDVNAGTHATKSLDDYVTEYSLTNPIFDLDTDYASEQNGWFFSPYNDPGASSSYGLPHFIAVCPDGSWKSLFQDDVFPASASATNAALRDFLNNACTGAALDVITLDDELAITVAPNPATDVINISLNSAESMEVSIINMMGAVVYTGLVNQTTQLDVSEYSSGIYVINVQTENGLLQEKFVIK